MINFRSMVLHAADLPAVAEVTEAAREFGLDISFESGFTFASNPKNRAGRVAIAVDERPGEIGYAIDPLELLIDGQDLPPELAAYGDVLVTFATPEPIDAVAAAAELRFAKACNAFGWRNDTLTTSKKLAEEAESTLRHFGKSN